MALAFGPLFGKPFLVSRSPTILKPRRLLFGCCALLPQPHLLKLYSPDNLSDTQHISRAPTSGAVFRFWSERCNSAACEHVRLFGARLQHSLCSTRVHGATSVFFTGLLMPALSGAVPSPFSITLSSLQPPHLFCVMLGNLSRQRRALDQWSGRFG